MDNRTRFPDVLNKKNLDQWSQLVTFLEAKGVNDFETLWEICEMEDKYVQSDSFKTIFSFLDPIDKGKLWGTMRELCFGTRVPQKPIQQPAENNIPVAQHFSPHLVMPNLHPLINQSSMPQQLFSQDTTSPSPMSSSSDGLFSHSMGHKQNSQHSDLLNGKKSQQRSSSENFFGSSGTGRTSPLSNMLPPLSTATYLKNADEVIRSDSFEAEEVPGQQKRPRCPEKEKCSSYLKNWTCPDYHTREEFKFLNNYRTSLCPNYKYGSPKSCKNGSDCVRAHGKSKLRCSNCRINGDHERNACKNPKYISPSQSQTIAPPAEYKEIYPHAEMGRSNNTHSESKIGGTDQLVHNQQGSSGLLSFFNH